MRLVVKEEQSMTQQWIWCILCSCVALCGWGMIRQITVGIDVEQKSVSVIYLFVLSAIPCLTLLYFYKNKLYTHYDQEGIKIKYFPFTRKIIRWNEIKSLELVELDLFTYSVWRSEKYGMIYNAKGNTVLQLETGSEKLLIGTCKPEAIHRIVSTYYQVFQK